MASMLREITLQCGRPESPSELAVPITPIVVAVGPNGSGKSLLLREIESFFGMPRQPGPARRIFIKRMVPNIDWEAVLSEAKKFSEDSNRPANFATGTFQPHRINPHTGGIELFNIVTLDQVSQVANGQTQLFEHVMSGYYLYM
jgi:hypothetical protein